MPLISLSQVTQEAQILDSAGLWSSNASYRAVSAVGQGSPVGSAEGVQHHNDGGFFYTFVFEMTADADEDGVIDEFDPDDDDDGLRDIHELKGILFDPVTATDSLSADSDADGATDSEESLAGTNPLDAFSLFTISDVFLTEGRVVLTWKSRSGVPYEIFATPSLPGAANASNVIATVSGSPGVGPWEEGLTSSTNELSGDIRFFGVNAATQW